MNDPVNPSGSARAVAAPRVQWTSFLSKVLNGADVRSPDRHIKQKSRFQDITAVLPVQPMIELCVQQWMVMIDLTATNPVSLSARGPDALNLSAQSKARKLKILADTFKNSATTMVVQLPSYERDFSAFTREQDDYFFTVLERFQLKSGVVTKISVQRAMGFADDLRDFIATSVKCNPAIRLALIIGTCDAEAAPPKRTNPCVTQSIDPAFIRAIAAGLDGSGHEKLDTLDLESFGSMPQSAFDQTQPIAKTFLANIEGGRTKKGSEGAEAAEQLSSLFRNVVSDGQ